MRGTKCLKSLGVSRLLPLQTKGQTQLTRRRIATELHPVFLIVSPKDLELVPTPALWVFFHARFMPTFV